jgi:hypothetical protein
VQPLWGRRQVEAMAFSAWSSRFLLIRADQATKTVLVVVADNDMVDVVAAGADDHAADDGHDHDGGVVAADDGGDSDASIAREAGSLGDTALVAADERWSCQHFAVVLAVHKHFLTAFAPSLDLVVVAVDDTALLGDDIVLLDDVAPVVVRDDTAVAVVLEGIVHVVEFADLAVVLEGHLVEGMKPAVVEIVVFEDMESVVALADILVDLQPVVVDDGHRVADTARWRTAAIRTTATATGLGWLMCRVMATAM